MKKKSFKTIVLNNNSDNCCDGTVRFAKPPPQNTSSFTHIQSSKTLINPDREYKSHLDINYAYIEYLFIKSKNIYKMYTLSV